MCVWENDDVVRHDDDDDDGKRAQKSEGRSAAHCWLAIHHQLFISKRVGIIYGGSAGELNTPESSADVNIGKVWEVYGICGYGCVAERVYVQVSGRKLAWPRSRI